jgi:hypothetical protein
MSMMRIVHTLLALALVAPSVARAETKDEWIALGARIRGAFGPSVRYDAAMSAEGLSQVEKIK